jgi:hypothetical protein
MTYASPSANFKPIYVCLLPSQVKMSAIDLHDPTSAAYKKVLGNIYSKFTGGIWYRQNGNISTRRATGKTQ